MQRLKFWLFESCFLDEFQNFSETSGSFSFYLFSSLDFFPTRGALRHRSFCIKTKRTIKSTSKWIKNWNNIAKINLKIVWFAYEFIHGYLNAWKNDNIVGWWFSVIPKQISRQLLCHSFARRNSESIRLGFRAKGPPFWDIKPVWTTPDRRQPAGRAFWRAFRHDIRRKYDECSLYKVSDKV